jgi:hypothetical protein
MPGTIPSPTDALCDLDVHLDLTDVRMKLADPEEGPGLDQAALDLAEREYRKFLALQIAHPEATIVPCQLVDQIWHQHILDTAAYRRDCEAIFGRFLDHYPYFGMRDEAEAQELNDAYADTLDLYRDAFGNPPPDTWVSTDPARCRKPRCRR